MVATTSQPSQSNKQGKTRYPKSKYHNVFWSKTQQKWNYRVKNPVTQKQKCGTFDDEEEAARNADLEVVRLMRDYPDMDLFHKINFPGLLELSKLEHMLNESDLDDVEIIEPNEEEHDESDSSSTDDSDDDSDTEEVTEPRRRRNLPAHRNNNLPVKRMRRSLQQEQESPQTVADAVPANKQPQEQEQERQQTVTVEATTPPEPQHSVPWAVARLYRHFGLPQPTRQAWTDSFSTAANTARASLQDIQSRFPTNDFDTERELIDDTNFGNWDTGFFSHESVVSLLTSSFRLIRVRRLEILTTSHETFLVYGTVFDKTHPQAVVVMDQRIHAPDIKNDRGKHITRPVTELWSYFLVVTEAYYVVHNN